MKLHFLNFLFLFLLTSTVSLAQTILLENIHYIDVEKGKVVGKTTVLIQDSLIVQIGKVKKKELPKETIVIDGRDHWLMPGLVDSHIHLFQSGGLYTRPDAIDLQQYVPYEQERTWVLDNAQDLLARYLYCGITTVVDVGGPIYNLALRDALKKERTVPNILMAGPLVSTFQPPAFDIENPPIIKVKSSEEARELVRKQLPTKPDFIKIWYITLPTQSAESTYDIVKATIDESHKHGLLVSVHATQLNTAKLAIKAGADVLVHSTDDAVDADFIKMLQENKLTYVPTLIVHGKYMEVFGQENKWSEDDFSLANPFTLGSLSDLKHLSQQQLIEQYRNYAKGQSASLQTQDSIRKSNLKILFDKKINIATGTDAGNIGTLHASSYYQELEAMQAAGLSNAQILKASTINAAIGFGKEKEFGSIAKGKRADLILLKANPLEDLGALKKIKYVINKGHLITPDSLLPSTATTLVQQQLNGYNAGDIDAFMKPYSDSVQIYTFPDRLLLEGKSKMQKIYGDFFKSAPNLHCELAKRMLNGNTVIDQEIITGMPNGSTIKSIAIYTIENNKIQKVYFIEQ